MGSIEQQRGAVARFLLGRRGSALTQEERNALVGAMSPPTPLPPRRTIARRGEETGRSTLIVSGLLGRYIDGSDGARQLVSVQVAGDFADLHAYSSQRLDHDVVTLTEAVVVTVSHDQVAGLISRFPRIAQALWLSTILDGASHREWIFRLGRLEAAGRLAHFLCETYLRLRAVGLASDGRFDFPLTQQDMAEACGLTSVHVNRTVRRLRETGLAEVSGEARIFDMESLAALGEFRPDYLFLEDARPLNR